MKRLFLLLAFVAALAVPAAAQELGSEISGGGGSGSGVSGSGTTGTVPVFASSTSLGDSFLFNLGDATNPRVGLGGTSVSFPALRRNATTLEVKLADASAFAPLSSSTHVLNGSTSGAVTLQVPSSVTSYSLTYPSAASANNNGVMVWSTAGVGTFATGTPSSSTFLRGDGSWQVPAAGTPTFPLLSDDVFSAATPSYSRSGDTNTGVAFPSADVMTFVAAGVEQARTISGGLDLGSHFIHYGANFNGTDISVSAVNANQLTQTSTTSAGGTAQYHVINVTTSGFANYKMTAGTAKWSWNTAAQSVGSGWDTACYLYDEVNTYPVMMFYPAASGAGTIRLARDEAFGWSSSTTAANSNANDTVIVRGGAAATLQLGLNAASGTAQTLKAADGTGGTGADLSIEPGDGSTTNAGGALKFLTAAASATYVERMRISAAGVVDFGPTTVALGSALGTNDWTISRTGAATATITGSGLPATDNTYIWGDATHAWARVHTYKVRAPASTAVVLSPNDGGSEISVGAGASTGDIDFNISSGTPLMRFYANGDSGTVTSRSPFQFGDGTTGGGATWNGKNGGTAQIQSATEQLTLSTAGATTDTTANLLPANSIIIAVTWRITTTIAGVNSTAMQVGDASTATRFDSTATFTSGTTGIGTSVFKGSITTDATGPTQTAAAKVRITMSGGADNTPSGGVVRITVYYITLVPNTSLLTVPADIIPFPSRERVALPVAA